jgi:CPA1 family monovalent cation:H+ antiporter
MGIENVVLHILTELLTPFLIYMIAEACAVSGVVAVFAAGIAHSFEKEQLNPEKVALKREIC